MDPRNLNDARVFFPDVIEGKIKTDEFLNAARHVVRIVEKLGTLFAPVKSDMQGNIIKLDNKYSTNREGYATLQEMILLENANETDLIATDALLWLTRALHMILLFFDNIIGDHKTGKPTEELVATLRKAYKEALEPYHGWMAQQLFGLLSRMVPNRSQLLRALANGKDSEEETVINDMAMYLMPLRTNISAIQAFYRDHNL